ncbi:hypothetical protein HDZ31DRAFT_43487 [Schizophyllum fasciatum]
MDENRDVICKKIDAVPVLSVKSFIAHFLPSQKLSPRQLGSVVKKLKKTWRNHEYFASNLSAEKKERAREWGTSYAPLGTNNCWNDYAVPPAKRQGTEKDVYLDLVDIHGQIVQCCLEVSSALEQTTALESNGSRQLSSQKINPSMPDGVHQLTVEHGGAFDWDSCTVIEEYKTMEGCANGGVTSLEASRTARKLHFDNSKKIIWGMHHILRTDPRRRFTFGITFANTEARLWHYNRAVIVVSEPFDFNNAARTLIDVYSRFAFASVEELGYDPTMHLLRDHPSLDPMKPSSDQYRVDVSGQSYVTVDVLSNQAAENGFGRCTRVFRAYKEEDAEKQQIKYYAIKDSWLEAGRQTELSIYQAIMKAIDGHDWKGLHAPAPAKRKYLPSYRSEKPADPLYDLSAASRKSYFIPVIAGGKVKVGDADDNTHTVIGRGYTFPLSGRKLYRVYDRVALTDKDGSVMTGVTGNEHLTGNRNAEDGLFLKVIPAREHHRIVMEEGQKLLDDTEIKTVFSTVKDAAYALFILHNCGFLYRDVSAGNILRHAGQGVLADLEYVRSVDEMQVHHMRTGTADFVAAEVVHNDFLSIPKIKSEDRITREVDDSDDDETPADSQPVATPPLTWRFRDVHDLESIYWLALWLLFRHGTTRPVHSEYDPIKQKERYNEIFPHWEFSDKAAREDVLKDEDVLIGALKLLPEEWNAIMSPGLRDFQVRLMATYDHRKGQPLHPTMWASVYLVCAGGERILGSFTPPLDDDGLNRVYPRTQHTSVIVGSQNVGTQESGGSRGSKRARQDMQSEGTSDAAGSSSAPEHPRPKKRKSASKDVPAQPSRHSTRLTLTDR